VQDLRRAQVGLGNEFPTVLPAIADTLAPEARDLLAGTQRRPGGKPKFLVKHGPIVRDL